MPTKEQVQLWSLSEACRAEHRELEPSILRCFEKKTKRRGRHPLRTPPEEL
jgi:hypothetical protein